MPCKENLKASGKSEKRIQDPPERMYDSQSMITKTGSKRVKSEWANGKGQSTQQSEVDMPGPGLQHLES